MALNRASEGVKIDIQKKNSIMYLFISKRSHQPVPIPVRHHRVFPSPDRSLKVWSVVCDEAAQDDGAARLEIFLPDWLALIIHCAQCWDWEQIISH